MNSSAELRPTFPRAVLVIGFTALLAGCNAPNKQVGTSEHVRHLPPQTGLRALVKNGAVHAGVPPLLGLAVAHVESRFNPRAYSSAGALGLMQIKCATARGEGFNGPCSELFRPAVNIRYGMAYLAGAMRIASGNECRAAGLYYSGHFGRPNMGYCRLVMAAKSKVGGE